jgi:hypothetical protein
MEGMVRRLQGFDNLKNAEECLMRLIQLTGGENR